MRQRLLSAAILVPIVVALFVIGDPWLWLAIAVLAALAAYETARLVRAAGLPADTWLAVILAPLVVILLPGLVGPGSVEIGPQLVAPAAALLVLLPAIPALRHRDPATGLRAWIATLLATAYPSLLAFAAALLTFSRAALERPLPLGIDAGRSWLLVLVLAVWALDSAAYVVGRAYGRGAFFRHISPKKTWSGAIGGTLAGVSVAALLSELLFADPLLGAGFGVVVTVSAQAGDLAESMLKRAAGVKDSGTLIPGHGGFLDRLDSFLFAAPLAWLYLVVTSVV